jgi:putative ABC transport system substrate-binding protein
MGRIVAIIAALLLPIQVSLAQTPERVARVGLLCTVSCDVPVVRAFFDTLGTLGWHEGRNLIVERRAAGGVFDRLPGLARELTVTNPNVIVASGPQGSQAAKDAAGSIPVVFAGVADPVAIGLVPSLARPGGNVTGVTSTVPGAIISKSFDLIRELMPKAKRVAVLHNPTSATANLLWSREGPSSAVRLGFEIRMFEVHQPAGIAPAVEAAAREQADILYVLGDPLFHTPPQRLADIALRARMPTMLFAKEVVQAGGLMSFGPDSVEMFRRVAVYVDKILRGARPADLPVEQPTRMPIVINLRTASAMGVDVPRSLRLRADELIE